MRPDVPEAIKPSISMSEANEDVQIHSGEFHLSRSNCSLRVEGKVYFSWLPELQVVFLGDILDATNWNPFDDSSDRLFDLTISGERVGEGFITNSHHASTSTAVTIRGVASSKVIKGDKNNKVEKILFVVPNLRDFFGAPVGYKDGKKEVFSMSRIYLGSSQYKITIDKAQNYDELRKDLSAKGGFLTLYIGELSKPTGLISAKEADEAFSSLSIFLSFINGRRTAPFFRQGYLSDQLKWTDYTPYFVSQFKSVKSWPQQHSINGISQLWNRFHELWSNKEDENFLRYAIHWYVEANGRSGSTVGAIIMAQTALELIYNWLLIEKEKLLRGRDAESISAANKIRLLLAHIGVPHGVPSSLAELQSLQKSKGAFDGPDIVVQVRNTIVHSQIEKRKTLGAIAPRAMTEVLELCLWYVEMALLSLLGFTGDYRNRLSRAVYAIDADEPVPWGKSRIQP